VISPTTRIRPLDSLLDHRLCKSLFFLCKPPDEPTPVLLGLGRAVGSLTSVGVRSQILTEEERDGFLPNLEAGLMKCWQALVSVLLSYFPSPGLGSRSRLLEHYIKHSHT